MSLISLYEKEIINSQKSFESFLRKLAKKTRGMKTYERRLVLLTKQIYDEMHTSKKRTRISKHNASFIYDRHPRFYMSYIVIIFTNSYLKRVEKKSATFKKLKSRSLNYEYKQQLEERKLTSKLSNASLNWKKRAHEQDLILYEIYKAIDTLDEDQKDEMMVKTRMLQLNKNQIERLRFQNKVIRFTLVYIALFIVLFYAKKILGFEGVIDVTFLILFVLWFIQIIFAWKKWSSQKPTSWNTVQYNVFPDDVAINTEKQKTSGKDCKGNDKDGDDENDENGKSCAPVAL